MGRSRRSPANRIHKNTKEKNRRERMKNLCSHLSSLIPTIHNACSKQAVYESAAAFIKQLESSVGRLKREKEWSLNNPSSAMPCLQLPVVEVKEIGYSVIETVLIFCSNSDLVASPIISVIQEEGAEIFWLSSATVGDKVFYTLHAQAKIARIGVDTTRLRQRLLQLVFRK